MAVCLHMDYLCYALVAVCGVYASSTMNCDDYAHWDTYARTLPVTPGQVVGCKYLLGLLFTLLDVYKRQGVGQRAAGQRPTGSAGK